MSKQINTLQEALTHYQQTCGTFNVTLGEEDENGVLKSYIYTERFRAESLYTTENDFANFPDKIKQLFNFMSADPVIMERSATGEVSVEEFVERVHEQSFLWNNGYSFATFIITDESNDAVVGSEVISDGSKDHAGEIAYSFNQEYRRSNTKKYVGYENVGALILGYGQELAKKQAYVNKTYDEQLKKFVGGEIFTTVEATTSITNIASKTILERLAFKPFGEHKDEVCKFELHYTSEMDAPLTGNTEVVLEWQQ
ncbi:GNAT family N-acetyltransferase [Candidatus Tisiphia endosymbiont of Micropterix aruncella]|uniref:GNAT family N-acetyltransferase n=1 Tax=Candidatus Tisiphia endosymbiont of Micropterix aruncella TaxID=3066271 RepID=UPI003AA7D590